MTAKNGLPSSRVEALSDGIFAVAMTILVLEIHVPDVAAGESLGPHLVALWPKIASYVVGFVVIGTLWVGHHTQFHYVRRVDRPALWINLLLLLAVSFLPFCVALLGTYHDDPLAALLYGAVVEVAGACLLAHWLYATHGRRLVAPDLDERIVRAQRGRVLVGVLGYAAGMMLALFKPRLGLLCYAGMPIVYLVPGRIDWHINQKDAHEAPQEPA